MSRIRTLIAAIGLSAALIASADYPEIRRLTMDDDLFRQLQADLQAYFQAVSRGMPALPGYREALEGKTPGKDGIPLLRFFFCRIPKDMDLYALAARLNLPYDTLATLNGLDNPGSMAKLESVLISNLPGLFIPERPDSGFQEILSSVSANIRSRGESVVVVSGSGPRRMTFYLGHGFIAVERAFFLNILFRFPLPIGTLTSRYGTRPDPFSGHSEFHGGVDIAAPAGTEVYAARDGLVERIENDPLLGKVVILTHEAGYQTVYGHLNEILVVLKQPVASGKMIGRVGSTGYSTGPHLHFEVRRQGFTRDPVPLLPRGNGGNP